MRKTITIPWGKLGICLLGLTGIVTLISLSYENNTLIFFVLLCATIAIFVRPQRKNYEIVPFAIGGIFGPTMEMIVIHNGGWQYANPTFGGIPVWLPLLWGLTVLVIYKITDLVRGAEYRFLA